MKNNEEKIKKTIAENIKKYRVEQGLSGRGLAKKAQVDEKIIRRVESVNYEFTPSISTLIKIANTLDIDYLMLLTNSEEEA